MKILLVLSFITCYSLSSFAQDEVISISQKSDVYNYHVLENKPLFGNTSKKEDSEKAFKEFIQNQIEGRRWRFTFLDLKASIKDGHEKVLKVIDVDRNDELEGFTLMTNKNKAIAVSSSRKDNLNLLEISW